VEIPLDRLLNREYLAARAAAVDPERAAADVEPGVGGTDDPAFAPDGLDDSGDTVYLTAVDRWGNAVSWIQSLFQSFGSGILEPESGVVLQNRGALFSLDEDHPNVVAPGKRPYHTLTPMMALRGEDFAFTLGTPGGDGQTQSLTQILNNLLLFGMTPQEAIEAPRFRSNPGLQVAIEDRIPASVLAELERRGHELRVVSGWTATFGGAQMILVEPGSGTLVVGSDPRREAYGLAY
jgi:gamma-glutamyltranspeptidase/glutathione hydrolase